MPGEVSPLTPFTSGGWRTVEPLQGLRPEARYREGLRHDLPGRLGVCRRRRTGARPWTARRRGSAAPRGRRGRPSRWWCARTAAMDRGGPPDSPRGKSAWTFGLILRCRAFSGRPTRAPTREGPGPEPSLQRAG